MSKPAISGSYRLDRVEDDLRALEARVITLERTMAGRGTVTPAPLPITVELAWLAAIPSLFGRALFVLGGAFFIRWLTETGQVVPRTGTTFGLVYALLWAAAAARERERVSASGHLLTAAAIAYPLVAEAASRFGSVGPPGAAALLVVATVVLLAAAGVARLAVGASVVAWAAALTGTFLALRLQRPDVFAAALLVIGIGSYVSVRRGRPLGIVWPPALAVDLLVLTAAVMATSATISGPAERPAMTLALVLAVPLAYGAAFLAGRSRGTRPLGAFEVLQGGTAVLVAAVSAPRVAVAAAVPLAWLSAAAALAGAATGAMAVVRARAGDRGGALFSAALATALAGLGAGWFSPRTAVASWCVLAILWAAAAHRQPRVAPLLSVACLMVAAVRSDLVAQAPALLLTAWNPARPGADLVAVTIAAGAAWVLLATAEDRAGRATALASGAVFLVGLLLQCLGALGGWLSGTGAGEYGAAARSALLAAAALGLTALAAWSGRASVRQLLVVVLAVTAGKLLFRDLFESGPGPLFVGFAAYGLALLLAARKGFAAREAQQDR